MSLKDAVVKARIEPELKLESEAILARLGMNTTDAIRIFFAQIRLQQGLPFSVRIPNAETQAAINELESGHGETVDSIDALFENIED
jgi:DNA-damage-inducible protein J